MGNVESEPMQLSDVMICATCGENLLVKLKSGKVGVSCACVRARRELLKAAHDPWKRMLKCRVCKEDRPQALFQRKTPAGGRQRLCYDCDETARHLRPRKTASEVALKHRRKHPEKYTKEATRDRFLKHKYNITQLEYDAVLAAQGGGCAICGAATPGGKRPFHVDHCHTNNQVRGILCHGCNIGLGGFKDNPRSLKRAILYLRNDGLTTAGLLKLWRCMQNPTIRLTRPVDRARRARLIEGRGTILGGSPRRPRQSAFNF